MEARLFKCFQCLISRQYTYLLYLLIDTLVYLNELMPYLTHAKYSRTCYAVMIRGIDFT